MEEKLEPRPLGRREPSTQVEPGAVKVFLIGWTLQCSQGSLRRVGDRSWEGKGHSFSLPLFTPARFPALSCRWLSSGLSTVGQPLLDTG